MPRLTFCRFAAVVVWGLVFFSFRNPALGQIAVNGLADKTIYNDSVTFTVPSQAGYNYRLLLDTNTVPVDTAITVARVEYHELQIFRTNQLTLAATNQLYRFIVRSSKRGNTEDGIPPWIPYPLINSSSNEFAGAHLRLITPRNFPTGYEIPVVAWVENSQGHAVRANGLLTATGQPSIQIR